MDIKKLLIFLLMLQFSSPLIGQFEDYKNLRFKEIILTGDTIISDSLTVIPGSIKLEIKGLKSNQYVVYAEQNTVVIKLTTPLKKQKTTLRYRVFPFNLSRNYARIDSNFADIRDQMIYIGYDIYSDDIASTGLIESSKLNYDGSFTRGLSFGNSQDLVLNSNLNLQMNGDLGNGLLVKAAISDENVPIQPEGNTQVLQEFDKVFVEISKDDTKLIAGDYEWSNPQSYFTKYYKKLKGLAVLNKTKLEKGGTVHSRGSYAVSRGKFSRINLETQEGNQGPYKLLGNQGERFLLVLSGTEKVYLDGMQLKRGLEHDYTIDYNRAEIQFTANRLITKDSRIIVEYEYSDQNYLRSLYTAGAKVDYKKLSLDVNIYNEQDSKTATGLAELDSTDISILEESGDAAIIARSGIFERIDEDAIPYTLVNDSILVYAPDTNAVLVTALFSDVGLGNGSYAIDGTAAANGRVYTYVGYRQGSYDPIIRLIAPEKKQLSTFKTNYTFSEKTEASIEFGLSNNDRNRFSQLDAGDDVGVAMRTNISDSRMLNEEKKIKLSSFFDSEMKQDNFQALNPYRAAEFSRDWNYENIQNENELLLSTGSTIEKEGLGTFSYKFNRFAAQNAYNGNRHVSTIFLDKNHWKIDGVTDIMNAKDQLNAIQFNRNKLLLSRGFIQDKLRIGAYYESENKNVNALDTKLLLQESFRFDIYKSFIEIEPNKDLSLGFSALKREDFGVLNTDKLDFTDAFEYEAYGKYNFKKFSLFDWRLKLRDLIVINDPNEEAKKTLLARASHKLNLLSNGLSISTIYEANSGQEPKLEEQFIEVRAGEGSYIWNDNDPMDSIQQINEFSLAPFSDQANFEKISLFNNEFIRTSRSMLNQTIKIEPKKWIIKKENSQKNILKKLSWLTRYRIDQKLNAEGNTGGIDFVDFNNNVADTTVVSYNASFDHTLYINRGSPNYDLNMGYRSLTNKINQINGFESRQKKEYFSRTRINLKQKFDLIFESSLGDFIHQSQMFENKRFNIHFYTLAPSITYRPKNNLRFIAKYDRTRKQNDLPGHMELASFNTLSFETTWRKASSSNLQLSFEYVDIKFDGEENTQLELEILEGLKNGSNYLWSLSYTKRLSNQIDMIINYNGRKTGVNRMIHVMSAQIKANF